MAIEKEKKYLVDVTKLPDLSDQKEWKKSEIQQAYIMVARERHFRVRIEKKFVSWSYGDHTSTDAKMCFKKDIDVENRYEFEKKILIAEAKQLMQQAECKLSKVRYSYHIKGANQYGNYGIISIDIYPDGLHIAEIELTKNSKTFEELKEDWMTDDVTGKKEYSNITLAQKLNK